ncbi:hypothetical protein KKF63_12290 [bacterium]|nr:hypothetical protein [bacterium]
MKYTKFIIPIFFLGSLWGLIEATLGEGLYATNIPHSSIYITCIAVFLLAFSRGFLNFMGTSALIGVVAAAYRLITTAFVCHFTAIIFMGVCFDVMATLIMKKEEGITWRVYLTGLLTPFLNNAAFVFIMFYVLSYEHWVLGGAEKGFRHIFVSGTITSLLGLLLVPLGFYLGLKLKGFLKNKQNTCTQV